MLSSTLNDLLADLGLAEDYSNPSLEQLIKGESKYLRDLRMNLKGFRRSKELNAKEVALISLAIANALHNTVLEKSFTAQARENEATEAEIADAIACSSLLSANNVFYRFRHYMGKDSYETMRAGLRMNIMMNPVLGKEFFELVSLAVSAVNGCEACVKSHEASLLGLGSTEARVFESVRLSAVIASLSRIIY